MTLKSFETSVTPFATDDGPLLERAPLESETAEQRLRIRARRVFPVSRNELFAAWTSRSAWESWFRLRARSRALVTPYPGGAFRLELAEGPTIHVISGSAREIRVDEFVSFTWIHHDTNDYGSIVEIHFDQRCNESALRLVHHSITSRREAAWLMRLWAAALDRLDRYVVTSRVDARRASSAA
jgi:uncharacterized protein YndB with AHSA1/START domain